jgi:hypothetical protein
MLSDDGKRFRSRVCEHEALLEQLKDERGKRVVFVSHCLLNENVRYLGGAFRRSGVEEVIMNFLRQGVGICQMPCPEQRAWGGVLKRYILPLYGSKGTLLYWCADNRHFPLVHPAGVLASRKARGSRYRGLLTLRVRSSGYRRYWRISFMRCPTHSGHQTIARRPGFLSDTAVKPRRFQ